MTVIRAASLADIPAITTIYNARLETTTHEWTETLHTEAERTTWLRTQAERGHPALVAVDGDDVVGWAAYGDFRDAKKWPGYIGTVEHTIHVRRDYWQRGIGRLLLVDLAAHAQRAGKHVMVAAIDSENDQSIRFHARLGFVEVARMPEVGTKFGRRLDLVLMQTRVDELVTREQAAP
jgi:L-amino acid N-acyltransferase YncA